MGFKRGTYNGDDRDGRNGGLGPEFDTQAPGHLHSVNLMPGTSRSEENDCSVTLRERKQMRKCHEKLPNITTPSRSDNSDVPQRARPGMPPGSDV